MRSNKFKFEQRKFSTQVWDSIKWGASCVCVWKIRWMDVKNTQMRKQKLKFLLRSFNFPKRWSRTSVEGLTTTGAPTTITSCLKRLDWLTHPRVWCDYKCSSINKHKCNRKALFRFTWQKRCWCCCCFRRSNPKRKSEMQQVSSYFPFDLNARCCSMCTHSRQANIKPHKERSMPSACSYSLIKQNIVQCALARSFSTWQIVDSSTSGSIQLRAEGRLNRIRLGFLVLSHIEFNFNSICAESSSKVSIETFTYIGYGKRRVSRRNLKQISSAKRPAKAGYKISIFVHNFMEKKKNKIFQ